MIEFLHTVNPHGRLEARDGASVAEIRGVTRRAFDNLIARELSLGSFTGLRPDASASKTKNHELRIFLC